MSGEGDVRHCASCDRDVHDLSAMSEPQAEAVLARPERVCVRFATDDAGSLVLAAARAACLFVVLAGPGGAGVTRAEPAPGASSPTTLLLEDLGDPLSAPIEVRTADGQLVARVQTDAAGQAIVPDLPPGDYFWYLAQGQRPLRVRSQEGARVVLEVVRPKVAPHRNTTMGEIRPRGDLEALAKDVTRLHDALDRCPDLDPELRSVSEIVLEQVEVALQEKDPLFANDARVFVEASLAEVEAACPPEPPPK